MRALTRWFLQNPVAANLLMIAIIAVGIWTFPRLRVESFPQLPASSVVVAVNYPGGSAEQVDSGITQRVEQAINDLGGVKRISSSSLPGLAMVRVVKTADADIQRLTADVRNRVNAIVGLPSLAETPQVYPETYDNLAAFVLVSGADDDALQPVARKVREALKRHPKIAKVSNLGARLPQLVIEPRTEQLQRYGISLSQLSERLHQLSMERRTGELKSEGGRLLLRGDGYADSVVKLNNLVVFAGAGGQVTLGQLARVHRGYESTDSAVRNNRQGAIALQVMTGQEDNLLEVSAAINEVLSQLRLQLPEHYQLSVMADMAPYIEEQLGRLGSNGWQGLLIVLVILGAFFELSLAFWVAAGIPISLLGALGLMGYFDYSLNDITLFGLILVLGILVDDAVVVGESIYAQRRPGRSGLVAAEIGVHRVSTATVFGVLTTIAAFSPMLWINNQLAQLLAGFSAVVIFALIFSLIESKLILPVHLTNSGSSSGSRWLNWFHGVQRRNNARLQVFNRRWYRPLLKRCLRHRAATLIWFVAAAGLAWGLMSTSHIRASLFPDIPGRYLTAKVILEPGASSVLQGQALKQLESSAYALEQELRQQYQLADRPFKNLLAWSDGEGSIETTAELSGEALAKIAAPEILSLWQRRAGQFEGGYSVAFSAAEEPAGGSALAVSSDDPDISRRIVRHLKQKILGVPGVLGAFDDGMGGQPQVSITLNAFGRNLGLSQEHLATLAGGAFGEAELHRLIQDGEELKVLLQYQAPQRISIASLTQTRINLPDGGTVALGDVADLKFSDVPQQVTRRDGARVVHLYWRQDRSITSPERVWQQLQLEVAQILRQYPGAQVRPVGEYEEVLEVQAGAKGALVLTLLLIYILLAVPLKSYGQPLVIMSVVPFGFAGAIFGHGVMGLPVSLLSLFGMMALTGIVVNDSLVLMTRFNEYLRQGQERHRAIVAAARSRLRPIFLTTATTVCGLLPMMMESSEQAQYLKPAVVSLLFGELFATAITLVLIPVLLSFGREKKAQQTGESLQVSMLST